MRTTPWNYHELNYQKGKFNGSHKKRDGPRKISNVKKRIKSLLLKTWSMKIRTRSPKFKTWSLKNAYCEFHLGVQGHSTEDCEALKYRVQAFMERGYLNFEKGSKEGLCQTELIFMTYTDLFPHLIANQMVKSVVSISLFP